LGMIRVEDAETAPAGTAAPQPAMRTLQIVQGASARERFAMLLRDAVLRVAMERADERAEWS